MRPDKSHVRLVFSLVATFSAVVATSAISDLLIPELAFGITIAAATCIVLYLVNRWFHKQPVYHEKLREIRATTNLAQGMDGLLMPFSIYAMNPAALANIVSHVQSRQSTVIIECGAGISTLLIGKALKQQGFGHLYSLEEDKGWFEYMTRLIADQEIGSFVTLTHAPLAPCDEIGQGMMWYSTTVVREVIDELKRLDLLIVDGPRSVVPLSRYPAFPFFAPKIDANTVIVLDDVDREYEKEVLHRWEQAFPLDVEIDTFSKRWQAYLRLRDADRTGPVVLRAF